jgi:dUTP pyrophosphatase
MKIQIKKVRENAIIPKYQTDGAAGFDVHALVNEDNNCYLEYSDQGPGLFVHPNTQCIVPTGLAFSIPKGMELQIRARSGLAAKKCITVTNSPGTLDHAYLNELFVLIFNLGKETFVIREGDRIAQCVLKQVEQAEFDVVDDFDEETKKKDRGGGLGSTGGF